MAFSKGGNVRKKMGRDLEEEILDDESSFKKGCGKQKMRGGSVEDEEGNAASQVS